MALAVISSRLAGADMPIKRIPGPAQPQLKALLNIKNDENIVGKVGFFESAKYVDGTPVAYVAAIQEYGSPSNGIPSRSFMRTTIAEKQKEWSRLAESGAKAILAGNETITTVLDKIGMKAAGDIRRKIASITVPPLKDSTIKNRLRRRADKTSTGTLSKPLIDTGIMIASVQSAVEPK